MTDPNHSTSQSERVAGIFSFPWPIDIATSPTNRRNPLQLYRKALWYKANPRPEAYMNALFRSRWPDGIFINADREKDWVERAAKADRIAVLYPDAIGQGFQKLETRALACAKHRNNVVALNGRRREFPLDGKTLRQLRIRRLIEKTFLGEAMITPLFLIATPVLFVIDLLRGRR